MTNSKESIICYTCIFYTYLPYDKDETSFETNKMYVIFKNFYIKNEIQAEYLTL